MRTRTFRLFPVLIIVVFFISQCSPANKPTTNPPTTISTTVAQVTAVPPTLTPEQPTSTTVPKVTPTDSPAPTVAAPPSNTSLDGQSLASERCTKCHSFTRIQNAKKSPVEWKSTVARMVGKGANLNSDEQLAVIEYLSKTFTK